MSWYDQEVPSDCSEFVPYLYKTPPVMSGILSLSSNVNKLQWVDDINSNSLGDVSHISKFQLRTPDNILDLALFRNIPDLEIAETESDVSIFSDTDKPYEKFSDECFSYTSHLTLSNIPISVRKWFEEGNVSFLNHLQSLTISSSVNIFSGSIEYAFNFPRLENIPLVILNSSEVKTVAGLRNNRCVELRGCKGIEDIESLSSVKVLTIDKCLGNYDDNVFSKVPRLKLMKASKIK
eukprot:gene9003-9749_t